MTKVEIEKANPAEMLKKPRKDRAVYAWNEINVGEAFRIKRKYMKHKTAVNYAYRMGKKTGKIFNVIDYGDYSKVICVELRDTSAVSAYAVKQTIYEHIHIPSAVPTFRTYTEQEAWVKQYRADNAIPSERDVLLFMPTWCNPVCHTLEEIRKYQQSVANKQQLKGEETGWIKADEKKWF